MTRRSSSPTLSSGDNKNWKKSPAQTSYTVKCKKNIFLIQAYGLQDLKVPSSVIIPDFLMN